MANQGKINNNSSACFLEYMGATTPGWMNNLALVRATTANTGDSIKITGYQGTTLSTSNPGYITLPHTTAGQLTIFRITSDITIQISGITPNGDGTGDLTGALLRVLAINDNGTIKWGIAYVGGRHTLLTTDTTATQASVTAPEHVLCNSAVGSSSNTCMEIGFVRADFTDSTNVWAIQSGVNDVVIGKSADGLWQPWNPVHTGFSADPTSITARWTQVGRTIQLFYDAAAGTSNATTLTITSAPAKALNQLIYTTSQVTDNSAATTAPGRLTTAVGSRTFTFGLNLSATGGFTNSGTKAVQFNISYEVGPAASFIN